MATNKNIFTQFHGLRENLANGEFDVPGLAVCPNYRFGLRGIHRPKAACGHRQEVADNGRSRSRRLCCQKHNEASIIFDVR
ncbi:MAG: hypothetical protein QX198_00625 [Methylococcaceae bacterium]